MLTLVLQCLRIVCSQSVLFDTLELETKMLPRAKPSQLPNKLFAAATRRGSFCRDSFLTSVAAEDLLVDDGGNGEAVEAVGESLPQLDVEPALAWWGSQ